MRKVERGGAGWVGCLHWCCSVWELVPSTLEQVVTQEESPEGVLDTSAHLHQISQHIFTRTFI